MTAPFEGREPGADVAVLERRPEGQPTGAGTDTPAVYTWGARPALDGLRAVAVYLVVLFHGGVTTFEGGFIGVDLFFVLSGFLVTNVVLVDMAATKRMRLARFYARRVRRLLPAAALAIVGTAIAFVLVAPPADRVALIDDARSAFLYFANWHFISGATDYFQAEGTAASPFLHFWSLSIEEQFYFVFPVTLLALVKLGRRFDRPSILPLGLAGLGLLSLAAQLYWASHDTVRAYYGTDARLYQMLAGAALAAGFHRWGVPDRFRSAGRLLAPIALVGFVLAATDVVHPSPSTRGILACVGAVVLLGALELDTGSRTAWIASRSTLVYLGQISYGTYLWHWPVIIVARRVGTFGPWELALISFAVGTALAALSAAVLEMPVRRSKPLDRAPRAVVVVGLSAGLLLALVVVPEVLRSERPAAVAAPGAVDVSGDEDFGDVPDGVDWEAIRGDYGMKTPHCIDGAPEDCMVVEGSGLHLHLIGDSHARMLLPLLVKVAREHDFALSASHATACPWQDGLELGPGDPDCAAFQDDQYERVIPALDPDIVVVMSIARDDPNKPPTPAEVPVGGFTAVRSATSDALDRLTEVTDEVVLIEPIPSSPLNPVSCLSGAERVIECAFEAAPAPLTTEVIYRYEDLQRDDVHSIDLDPAVCPDLPLCVPIIDGEIVRHDATHLRNPYAESIADYAFSKMEEAGVFDGVGDG